MKKSEDLLMDISILYRSTQKYYDRKLEPYHITYAQLPILLFIFEEEGITMQKIVEKGSYDKGTVTKNVKKLESLHYVEIIASKEDKRVKHLYTTYQAKQIIAKIYKIRNDWWNHIIQDIDKNQLRSFEQMYGSMCLKANEYANLDLDELRFYEWRKCSLNAYPGQISTVLKVGGCNLRCPGCCKKHLVFLKDEQQTIGIEDVKMYLEQNRSNIQAVSIEGGEIGLHPNLAIFFQWLKEKGFLIKINTNGMYPQLLEYWISNGWIDFIELDLKGTVKDYPKVSGIHDLDTHPILQTLALLAEKGIDHRFTTTLIKDFHDEEKLIEIAKHLGVKARWIWYPYHENEESIQKGLQGFSIEEMQLLKEKVEPYVGTIEIKYNR